MTRPPFLDRLDAWWFGTGVEGGLLEAEWRLPVARLHRLRPVGGILIRTPGRLEFRPNLLEATFGGLAWHAAHEQVGRITLDRRVLAIGPHAAGGGAPERFVVHRTRTARALLPIPAD